jgi:flagellar biosynthesis GTPase FlhF
MKKLFLVFPALIILAGFYTGHIIDDRAKTLLQTLKLSENDAKNTIFSDISSNSFYLPGIKELKSIASRERASQVEVVGKYVKDFTATEDFKKQYNEYRELRKPSPPEKPKTAEELKNEYKADLQKSLEKMKESKSQAPADQQAMYDETIKMYEEQLKEIDDPNNPMFSPEMDTYSQMGYEQQMEQHKKDVAEWETKYPINNPKPLIKIWLESFLEQTKDVDFNAQTAIDKDRTLFVKQEYERKNNMWKLCFRAGKETTEAGRKFAQTWLGELK